MCTTGTLSSIFAAALLCSSSLRNVCTTGTGTGRANGNDGPKWTCGVQLLQSPCLIFSLGSSNVIDFESEMYKWGRCSVHVFDPTVDGSIAPELKRQVCMVWSPTHSRAPVPV